MKVERTISIGRHNNDEKAVDASRHLTAGQRRSMVEDLRQELTKVTRDEYPSRLRRVITVVKRGTR